MPGTAVDSGNTSMNKTKLLLSWSFHSNGGGGWGGGGGWRKRERLAVDNYQKKIKQGKS